MQLTPHLHLIGSATHGTITSPWDCHVFLIDGGSELALVDAGSGLATDALLANVAAVGYDPDRIQHLLLTHGHADHAGGAHALHARLPNLKIHAHPTTRRALATADERTISLDFARAVGVYPPDYRLTACPTQVDLVDGRTLAIGDLLLRPLATPGHCADHFSLLLKAPNRLDLLAGDTIFPGGRIALLPIHDCDLTAMIATLRRLRPLPIDGLFAGHGPPITANGRAHIEHANRLLDRMEIPPPLHPAEPLP